MYCALVPEYDLNFNVLKLYFVHMPVKWFIFEYVNASAWLNGVLPLVWDKEMSIQDKCLELLEEVILSNIVPCHR